MSHNFQKLLQDGQLTVCVDDFGLTPGINKAVIDLAKKGKINATSVLVDGKYLDLDEVEKLYLMRYDHNFQIGLHLNFTELLSNKQDEELVKPIGKQILTNFLSSSKLEEAVYNEISRQFNEFERLFDIYPDFIDGHQHVHLLPIIFKSLVKFYKGLRLDDEEIWVRSLNRVHLLNKIKLPGASSKKNWILRLATKKANAKVFTRRRELLGVYNFDQDSKGYQQLFVEWLNNGAGYINETGRGAVIMCHPSHPDIATPEDYDDPIAEARKVEYEMLSKFQY